MSEPENNDCKKCWGCHRPKVACWCHVVRPLKTETRFVILMHPKEAKKEPLGTGRMSHRFLENSKILVGLEFSNDQEFLNLFYDDNYRSVLLYPGKRSVSLNQIPAGGHKPLQIFLIDGTWPCAKKLLKLNSLLHHLPLVSFSNISPSKFDIKQQPKSFCLSTIEAIYNCILELNISGQEDVEGPDCLLNGLKFIVDYQIKCANDPEIPSYRKNQFTPKSERIPAKKWEKRSLFLNLD